MNASVNESEELEQEAWKDAFAALEGVSRRRLGLSTERFGRALVLGAPGVRHFMLNRVIGFGEDGALSASAISAHYAGMGVTDYMVHVSPGCERAAAAELCVAGLVPFHRPWLKLARRSGPLPESPGSIEVARVDSASAETFAMIIARNFELPRATAELWMALTARSRWYCFLARDAGRAIAAASLFVDGDVGYLQAAATSAECRGRGAQSALIAHRLRLAFSLGCRTLYTETGVAIPGEPNPSERNLLRFGFKPLAVRQNFVPASVKQRRTLETSVESSSS
ncbi:MAG TPA: GNAT family N-acetyltransferase [Polyangiaceae bacterium]|nr:GNAT family N-acetyltransferase [Polyangiaceae bacterium]